MPDVSPTGQRPPTDSAPQRPRAADARGAALIAAKARTLPQRPGVYRMMDDGGKALYVGKARNLRRRVTSYAAPARHGNRIAHMISRTADITFAVTRTETDALLLEANLIKHLKPPFNILLRDDKSFPHILITADHPAAQVLKHRGARRREGEYFGPFASAGAVNRTLDTLQRAFLLRTCSDAVYAQRTRPCLLHQIKRCSAPCTGEIALPAYRALVGEARDFLAGRHRRLQEELSQRMAAASAALDFEQAAVCRDRIRALTQVQARQGVNPATVAEADLFAAAQDGGQTCVQVFFFRAGLNWGNRAYFPRHAADVPAAEVLGAFIAQFYDTRLPPPLVLVSGEVPDQDLLVRALTSRAQAARTGRLVKMLRPRRGEKKTLMDQALVNARDTLAGRIAESAGHQRLLQDLAGTLDLERTPRRIEVYDNSHMQGAHPTGAMIVAGPEGFQKSEYRKFNIRSGAPGDDYAMMREVLTRRFGRMAQDAPAGEAGGGMLRPDLMLLDGGAGQLAVALEVAADVGAGVSAGVAMAAIAKGPDRHAGRERFFLPGRAPFTLAAGSPVLHYLQRLRDEAHRFAIGAHRTRRAGSVRATPLDGVPGVGPRRKRALLHHFGSARAVTQAPVEELQEVAGISKAMARAIHGYFHDDAL